ncbi:MAG TPA: ABC transporter permease subunit [Vicinamibacteria bacterium]|nr:ABC transporter permease subunit [Vicinamibacteria bacterium]HRB12197.1 ABC transporter permease subunit [Vicinamibacteria bacterium]
MNLRLFAAEELKIALRSRWTQIFAVVFAILAAGVAAAGYVISGGHGVQDFSRTSASLVHLVVLIVPLVSLMLGVLSLSLERGAAEMVFALPVSRWTILLGRMLGLFVALALAQSFGFGLAGLLVYTQSGPEGVGDFIIVLGASLLATAVFLALAALLSADAFGRRRTKALALALVAWLVGEVFIDLAALGLATFLPSGAASRVLILASLLNPIGALRTGALLLVEGTGAFGAASLALLRFTHGPAGATVLIALSLLTWIVVPALWAGRRLERADI